MSRRMIRRIDTLNAYGRWAALIVVSVLALLANPRELEVSRGTILIVTGCVAVIDAIPVILLHLGLFPDLAAYAFSILDSLVSVVMLVLGGPSLLLYSFFPVISMGVRFDWAVGLVDAAILAVGHIVIVLVRAGVVGPIQALVPIVGQSLTLVLVSVLSGLLAESIKREPPLNEEEAKAQEKEIRRLQAAADRAGAIYEMASTLSATLNYEKILDAVLEISAVGFDDLDELGSGRRERSASAVFLNSEKGLSVAASRGLSHEESELPVSGTKGVLQRVLSGAEAFLTGNLADDAELGQFAPFRRCRSAVCVPLRAGFEVYGTVLFTSPRPDAFTDEHIELLRAVSSQAVVALTNAQLYQDLQKEKEQIIMVGEEARAKLARDLHDGPTQSISAIAMRLNFVRLLLGRDPPKVRDELFKLENLARRTTKEIRTMLFTLRPVVLETQGLKAAVKQLVEKFQEMDSTPITLEIEDLEGRLDVSMQAVAWFITEECLNNARKYAKASRIWVRMFIRDQHFVTEIEDDGEGFDVADKMDNYDESGSLGLLNILERAQLVNGRATIESTPGEGTIITMLAPLSRDAI